MASIPVVPGQNVGPLYLGASLQEVLTIVKADKAQYPKVDLLFDRAEPLQTPVVVSLLESGLRLRFDGPEQRLRLIEVMDFDKARLTFKGTELVKANETRGRPAFKRIYQIFGAAYPGEYHAPQNGAEYGNYVLSWAGIAFVFPLQHSAWSAQKDHVSLLSSSSASPATTMAVFEGSSWPEAQRDLFIKPPNGPRLSALIRRSKDTLPGELESAIVRGKGQVLFLRRQPFPSFSIMMNKTTPQDLITEFGPPDAIHKRDTLSSAQHQPLQKRKNNVRPLSNGRSGEGSQPSSYSSTGTDTYDVDFDSGDGEDDTEEQASRQMFWCYFSHGMDILIGPPSAESSAASTKQEATLPAMSSHLVVTKVIIHGNVPGSYAFNRHRRLRWTINLPNTEYAGDLTSETKFDDLKPSLVHIFQSLWPASEMAKGKVVNRTWAADPSDSTFFLPDAGEDLVEGGGSEQWLGNTRLFSFPGMTFEVLENGAVSALTVH